MKYWITQKGERLAVKDMATKHIQNCIRMLNKHLENKPEYAVYTGNSEYAEQAVEQENNINFYKELALISAIRSFERELKRRTKEVK
jgi:histidine ammonia-lyase